MNVLGLELGDFAGPGAALVHRREEVVKGPVLDGGEDEVPLRLGHDAVARGLRRLGHLGDGVFRDVALLDAVGEGRLDRPDPLAAGGVGHLLGPEPGGDVVRLEPCDQHRAEGLGRVGEDLDVPLVGRGGVVEGTVFQEQVEARGDLHPDRGR